mmetsp:Transcript_9481/g.24584  ORF Transcript_9481/g.24584 Transcript_9481/m.24584 type:complete len:464 (+) Transcript_9481:160-1551(+)
MEINGGEAVTLKISSFTGKALKLPAERQWTVDELKARIEADEGIPKWKQALFTDKRKLEDTDLLNTLPTGDSVHLFLINQEYLTNSTNSDRSVKLDGMPYSLQLLDSGGERCNVYDINLHKAPEKELNVQRYYSLCKDYIDLHVTTSCFTIWRQNKKTNGSAKVIPTLPAGHPEEVRVFFFDDNLEWDGTEEASGICNLRDATTGKFVDFAEGTNGFVRERAGRHTVIQHSSEWRCVLVKANILDAYEDPSYFIKIIQRFSHPGEKLIVYMDVNSTIVCNDTVQGKDVGGTLLSTMFEFVEVGPPEALDLNWEGGYEPVRLTKKRTLKQVVKEMTLKNHDLYTHFWEEDICWRLFTELAEKCSMRWSGTDNPINLSEFRQLFSEYVVALKRDTTKDGIAHSWFKVFEVLKGRHTVVLNSFGVDTRKVVLATLPDEKHVIQVCVNYELWDERDVKKFNNQFTHD